MKRIHVRILLAFIFLALVQIACGCSVDRTVNVFVYEDTNGDGMQNQGEPEFPGIGVYWEAPGLAAAGSTNSNGQISFSHRSQHDCIPDSFPVFLSLPFSYRVSEYTGKTPWNCSPPAILSFMRGMVYDEGTQHRDLIVGLAA